MKKRNFIKAIVTIGVILALCVPAFAPVAMAQTISHTNRFGLVTTFGSDEFCVKYNGEAVVFPDAQPYVDAANRTLVPVRFVSEKMTATVEWDAETRTVTIAKGDTTVKLTIGSRVLSVMKDGATSTVTMDTEAVITEDRTFVPVRFVAEALGAWVGYSNLFNTAQIYSDKLTPEEIDRLHGYYDMTHAEQLIAEKEEKLLAISPQSEWDDSNPQLAHFVGTGEYGFANANEWTMRSQSQKWETYRGYVTGKTFKKGVQPEIEFAKLAMEEAKSTVTAQFYKDGAWAGLKTDLSCVFCSRAAADAMVYVRGVLVIAVPKDANAQTIAALEKNFGCKGIKAGDTASTDVEVHVATDFSTGGVYCRSIHSLA